MGQTGLRQPEGVASRAQASQPVVSVLSLVLALALAPSTAPSSDADPRSVAKDVAAKLEAGDEAGARSRIEDAYAANPDPRFIYMKAALEERVGHCAEAIPLYQAFLTEAEDPADRVEAEAGLQRCGAPVEPEPTPPPEPAAPPPVVERIPPEPTPQQPRWTRDALGWSLTGLGLASSVAGGVLLALADRSARAANTATQQSLYDAERARVGPLRLGGAVALSAGGALIVGGIVRFIVVHRRGSTRLSDRAAVLYF